MNGTAHTAAARRHQTRLQTAEGFELLPLLEFSKVVNSSLDLSFVLGSVLLSVMGKLLVTKGVVLLKRSGSTFAVQTVKGLPREFCDREITISRPSKKNFLLTQHSKGLLGELSAAGIERMFPIIAHDALLGYFGFAHPPRSSSFAAPHRKFIEALINVAAAAIEKSLSFAELQSVNRRLDSKVQQLNTLFELSKEFSGVLEREQILRFFSLTLMGQIGTNRFALCLRDQDTITSRVAMNFSEEDKRRLFALITEPVLIETLRKKRSFARVCMLCEQEKIAAVIPLHAQNEVAGLLCVGERLNGAPYTREDLEFLYSLGALALISTENARLFQEALRKKQMEDELAIARGIQQHLLPSEIPEIAGFECAALNVSSQQVGGDYYDLVPVGGGSFIIAIGDVSGKGTPASLLMANVQATIRALAPFGLELGEATGRVNDIITSNTGNEKFITFFWGVLDPATKTYRYVNAGHNPPYVLRADGTMETLTEGGLILGVMQTLVPYKEGAVTLRKGDAVVLFTDGVSEAMNLAGEDYGDERLEKFLCSLHHSSAREIVDALRAELAAYTAGAPQSDDITIVVLRCME
ncbi:MAG: PP2C family protein-serine/threonine phosphatase [Acidobacteriota bacterium]